MLGASLSGLGGAATAPDMAEFFGTAASAPVAALTVTPQTGTAPLQVTADSSASSDPNGGIASRLINFGDGTTSTSVTAAHTYNTAGTFTINLSVTDNLRLTSSTSNTVTVQPFAPPSISVAVSPTSATVSSGGSRQFTATMANTSNQAVTWTATAGAISSGGFFTAPVVSTSTKITVKASSLAAPSKAASATVIVQPIAPPPISVAVSPTPATVSSGGTRQFRATVANAMNQVVSWTATAGAISKAGFFTAPVVSTSTKITVKASSLAAPSKTASATVRVQPSAPPAISIAAGNLQALSAPPLISDRGYPIDAYHVGVENKLLLQTALSSNLTIRLDANADYSASGLPQLVISSGQRVYGLPGTVVPPIVVTPGTTMSVLSRLKSASVTFPISSISTHDNLFLSINSRAIAVGATLDKNLFVDWNGGLQLDASSTGRICNNRFIRTLAHGNYNPYLLLKGNAQNVSTNNVFLFYNFLTPPGNSTDLSGQQDLTMVGVDAEAWNNFGWGQHAVITTASDVGTLRFFVANGGDNSHLATDPAATGYFDIAAQKFLLFNDISTAPHNPKTHLQSTVQSAVMLSMYPGLNAPRNGFLQDSNATFLYQAANPGSVQTPLSVASVQSLHDAMIGLANMRTGQSWEAPIYDPVPDPGGPSWNQDLASKHDSTSYIQNLIDTNGVAFLPAGTYYISQPLRLKSTQGLIGAGMSETLIVASDPTIDMIIGDDHASQMYQKDQLLLSDLTLQGGKNGLHHDPNGSGSGAQYNFIFLSHVTFRNMSNAGIFIDRIVAWDNNLVDHVNFVNCGTGFLQLVDPSYVGGNSNGMMFMDKTVFYRNQFIGNGLAMNLPARRPNGLDMWVENLFQDNQNGVANMTANLSGVMANSDFINNGGPSILRNDGNDFNLVSDRFSGGTSVQSLFNGAFSVEGSTFLSGGGSATIIANGNRRCVSFYDSISDMPVGAVACGFFFDNSFQKDSRLSVEGVVVNGATILPVLPSLLVNLPIPQLLRGAPLTIRY
jgi:hypothetical protein